MSTSISAWIILDSAGTFVARVVATHRSAVTVEIWQSGPAADKSAAAYKAAGGKDKKGSNGDNNLHYQKDRASGYGYDKETSAMVGMYIDGHKLSDHCSRDGVPEKPEGSAFYPRDMKEPAGYSFANWARDGSGWEDCYKRPGLQYLKGIGYSVIRAV